MRKGVVKDDGENCQETSAEIFRKFFRATAARMVRQTASRRATGLVRVSSASHR